MTYATPTPTVDRPRVCIDRLLPRDILRHQEVTEAAARSGTPQTSRAIIIPNRVWPNGSKLRVQFLGGSAAQQAKVREQAQWWSQVANVTFEFGTDPQSEIRIAFDPADGAWSYVGLDCAEIPFGQPTMNLGFLDGGTAGHEFGHALGLAHEHSSPFGGIVWNEAQVIADLSGPPNNWTEDQIRHNVFFKYSASQVNGTDFDPKSIMLYFFPDTWVVGGTGTSQNDTLSITDKTFIGGANAYPKSTIAPIKIKVGATRRTRSSISTPGEQDLFDFEVLTPGKHVLDTNGSTDVMLSLFGPNNQTALVATDDDGGAGGNARIVASLVAGTYVAQVRHFDDRALANIQSEFAEQRKRNPTYTYQKEIESSWQRQNDQPTQRPKPQHEKLSHGTGTSATRTAVPAPIANGAPVRVPLRW